MEKIIVTILGSGTCVPSLKRSSCAILIQIDRIKMVFDIGPGTTRRLLQTGTGLYDISHIFLSHFHPDHSGELASFLFSYKHADPERLKIPLTVVGGSGFSAFYEGLKKVFGHWITFDPEQFTLIEMNNLYKDSLNFGIFSVEAIPVNHNSESIAYKIRASDGTSVVYSGDTDYCDGLIEIAGNADLLILESSFPDNHKVKGHLTPSLAGEVARNAGARRLALTHFYPECDTGVVERECRKTYHGPLILAEDLMIINV